MTQSFRSVPVTVVPWGHPLDNEAAAVQALEEWATRTQADLAQQGRFPNRRLRRQFRLIADRRRALDLARARAEEFAAIHADAYRRFGQRVDADDRAGAIYAADEAAYVSGADIEYIEGRIVLVKGHR